MPQALVAFLGDSPDAALVEDFAVSLAGMLQPASLLRPALITTLQVRLASIISHISWPNVTN